MNGKRTRSILAVLTTAVLFSVLPGLPCRPPPVRNKLRSPLLQRRLQR